MPRSGTFVLVFPCLVPYMTFSLHLYARLVYILFVPA
jgi:hypothetical protein